MKDEQDIRWKQRFDSFHRAFSLLREIIEDNEDLLALEPIVKEGAIQRFGYTLEMAWKVLKDKMEYDGILIKQISPRYVLKLAYQRKYIDQIEIWLKMFGDRNLTSHTYNHAIFDKVLPSLQTEYFPLLGDLYGELLVQRMDDDQPS